MAACTIAKLRMLSLPIVSGMAPVRTQSRNSAIAPAWPAGPGSTDLRDHEIIPGGEKASAEATFCT